MHERLELAVVAHAIEERVSDEGDACAWFQLQRELGKGGNGKQEAEEEALHEMERLTRAGRVSCFKFRLESS
jgi:hypothetical protein